MKNDTVPQGYQPWGDISTPGLKKQMKSRFQNTKREFYGEFPLKRRQILTEKALQK